MSHYLVVYGTKPLEKKSESFLKFDFDYNDLTLKVQSSDLDDCCDEVDEENVEFMIDVYKDVINESMVSGEDEYYVKDGIVFSRVLSD